MNAVFIGICILIYKRQFINFVLAPAEADMQVGHSHNKVGRSRNKGIHMCQNLDLIVFGNLTAVIVDVWPRK